MAKCPINLQSCISILDQNPNNQDYYGVQIILFYTKKKAILRFTQEKAHYCSHDQNFRSLHGDNNSMA